MIRWWDYVVGFLYADLMAGFLLMGFTATTWYMPLVAGGIVAFLWRSWCDFYCEWRLYHEEKQN